MPLIAKYFKHIKVSTRRNTISLAVITDDLFFRFRNTYDRSEMDDFDKSVIELALTSIAQGRSLYLEGAYEGDGRGDTFLDIAVAVAATTNN